VASETGGTDKGFTVVDRRGERSGEETKSASEEVVQEAAHAGPEARRVENAPKTTLPRIDFATFVLSLSTSALFHLGLLKDPETGQAGEPNLPLARQTVDTLELLQEKTRGNLTPEEEKLLQGLLTDVRMRVVQASK